MHAAKTIIGRAVVDVEVQPRVVAVVDVAAAAVQPDLPP